MCNFCGRDVFDAEMLVCSCPSSVALAEREWCGREREMVQENTV